VGNLLAMNARALGGLGVAIDPATGKVAAPLSTIFRENPLIGSSPALSKQLARYVQSYDAWLNGIDLGIRRTEGIQIAPTGSPYDMARSNLVNLRPVPGRPGVLENDFLRNDNGTVTFKPQAEINQVDQLRKDQLAAAIGTALKPASDTTLGPRMVDGKRVISGAQLPATMGALQHFGPWIQSIANTFRLDAGQGGVYQVKYNRIGTGESGAYRVIKLGNIRSITRNFWEPFEYSVSKQGHLLAHMVDDSAVQRNVLKGINDGLLPYHNNDAAAVHDSLITYLDNHKRGLPSENGIGIGQRNEINALLTSFSKNHRSINPLAHEFGPQGVIRRIRMDRIEDMSRVVDQDKGSPTYGQPKAGFHFDYFKVNNNMMPDAGGGGKPLGSMYAPDVGPKPGFIPKLSAVEAMSQWGNFSRRPTFLKDHKVWVISQLRDLSNAQGWNHGWKIDPEHKGPYPWVYYSDTPAGQISFHSSKPDTMDHPELDSAMKQLGQARQNFRNSIPSQDFPDLSISQSLRNALESKTNFSKGGTADAVRSKLMEGISIEDLVNEAHGNNSSIKSLLYKIKSGWDAVPELAADPISQKILEYHEAAKSMDDSKIQEAEKNLRRVQNPITKKIYEGDWDGVRGQQVVRLAKLQEMFPGWLSPKGGPPQ